VVLLGVHDLHNESEVGREEHLVSDIRIHRNWNPNLTSFNADIAVLKMKEEVKFSTWIQPVCMSKLMSLLNNFQIGETVGFGRSSPSESNESVILKKMSTPIHNNDYCFNMFPSLINIAKFRTFCGGFANETESCDNGGNGMTVVQDGVHYLRGIVSASLRGGSTGCSTDAYTIFTDIRYYLSFLKSF